MFKPLTHQGVPVHHFSNPAERLTFWQAEFEAYMTSERGCRAPQRAAVAGLSSIS